MDATIAIHTDRAQNHVEGHVRLFQIPTQMLRTHVFTLLIVFQLALCSHAQDKPKLTVDEYLDYVNYPSLSISPSGQHLLIEVLRPSWNTSTFETTIWLHDVQKNETKLVTSNLGDGPSTIWSPSGEFFTLFLNNDSSSTKLSNGSDDARYYMHLYSVVTDQLFPVSLGSIQPSALDWSRDDKTLYLTSLRQRSKEEEAAYASEWKNTIVYRDDNPGSMIHRLDLNINISSISGIITTLANVSFSIPEILYVPFEDQLVFSSRSKLYEDVDNFELYSIRLNNPASSLKRLTFFEGAEQSLQLSNDGKHIVFKLYHISSGKVRVTQQRLYSLNLANNQIERLAQAFEGGIQQMQVKSGGGVYFTGQVGLETEIYTLESLTGEVTHRKGWSGKYEELAVSSQSANGPLAFVFSSFERPREVYIANSIDQLLSAKPVTNNNELFTQRSLPHSQSYRWTNTADKQQIEGVLHYPPGQNGTKNLPLFIYIHGGPFTSSLNEMQADWYKWALMAATEGWLVLEPNYRGTPGYGDAFLDGIRTRPVSMPGQDILMGVDQLIREGIADPKRLAVGGYSYGGFLTNWLITQTTRFNAALTGAGDAEHASGWGTMDLPVVVKYLHGGFPWEVPRTYHDESPVYAFKNVRTPTHMVTGQADVRVNPGQSHILERALRYVGVPSQLLLFPGEGHNIDVNPWFGKIKLREEIKWLQKYGSQSLPQPSHATINAPSVVFFALSILMMIKM